MDQNQTVDNDLQKAIDNITNNTNTDPVFSDPVAAPSSIPEGDTGELGEPVGPFPEAEVKIPPQNPEPIAPFEPIDIPELNLPENPSIAPEAPVSEQAPVPETTVTEPTPIPEAPVPEQAPVTPEVPATNLNTNQVKEAALRDLIPLLDHVNMTPSQKFSIYKNAFEGLRDYTVLEQAYRAASEIADDTERAEALLYLVESIDKM